MEAENLISLCRRLVEKKSILVLEGCVSLALSRYRKYIKEDRPGGAVHWLLVGMELEAIVYAAEKDGEIHNWDKMTASSICYRHLYGWFIRVAGDLLVAIMDEKEGLGLIRSTAKAMLESAKEGPMEGYVLKLFQVRTLEYVLGIYEGLSNSKNWSEAARNIKLCLQEEPNELENGVVLSVAHRSMHLSLLRLGHRIVDEDEKRQATARAGEHLSSFDVKGIQVLMEQLAEIPLCLQIEGSPPIPEEEMKEMRLSLAKGLARAFVAENALRKDPIEEEPDDVIISRIRSVDLHKHSLRTQERVVQMMLEY